MRTLKKTLALVLVVAMALSFGVIGANAAFTDVPADHDYNEAIQVLSGIGVLNGMTATTFVPNGSLTRAQAAKIVAYLKLGPTYAQLVSSATSQRFDDVATSYWAAGYIEYCANLGIISGVGDNKFDPEGVLTTAAFTKMVLVAVGYDPVKEGFTGASWALNVASAAVDAEIFDDGIAISATATCTRAQAAQLAFKALFYAPEGTATVYLVGGVKYSSFIEAYLAAGSDATKITTGTDAKGSLAKTVFSLTKGEGFDGFGRPATVYSKSSWEDDLTFANPATFTFTATVTETALAKTLKNYDVTGLASDRDTVGEIAGLTGNGVTVEIYAGSDKVVNAVVVIAPVFGEVTVVSKAATKTAGAYTKYTVGGKSFNVFSTVVNEDKDVSKATVTGTVEDGDMVLYYYNDAESYAYIEAVDTISGVLSSASSAGVYTIGGEAYKLAKAGTAPSVSTVSQTFYVDSFGYILGVAEEGAGEGNYALVVSTTTYNILKDGKIVATFYATLAYTDGTVAEVATVDKTTSAGKTYDYVGLKGQVVTYKVGVNGTVLAATDKEVALPEGFTKGNAVLKTGALYANADTKFVFVNWDKETTPAPDGTVTVYTGIKNVPTTYLKDATYDIYGLDTSKVADQIADVVFVYENLSTSVVDSYVYVTGNWNQTSAGYVYEIVKGGKLDSITVTEKGKLEANTLYKSVSDDGTTTTGVKATTTDDKVQNVGGLLFVNGSYSDKTITSATPVYVIDKYDDEVIVKTFADITSALESTDNVYIVEDGSAVAAIYVLVNSAV